MTLEEETFGYMFDFPPWKWGEIGIRRECVTLGPCGNAFHLQSEIFLCGETEEIFFGLLLILLSVIELWY